MIIIYFGYYVYRLMNYLKEIKPDKINRLNSFYVFNNFHYNY